MGTDTKLSDRLYLLRRRWYWTRRLKRELGFTWAYAWDRAGANQRWALQQAYEVQRYDLERDLFAAQVLADLDQLEVTESAV